MKLLLLLLLSFGSSTLSQSLSGTAASAGVMKRFIENLSQRLRLPGGKLVVCYFINWGLYRAGAGRFTPENVDASLCTDIVYAFAGLDEETLLIKSLDPNADIDKGFYKKIAALKKKGVKVSLGLGGWTESGQPKYSLLLSDANSRARFVQAAIRFLSLYGLCGLHLDHEYPTSPQGGEGNLTDRDGYRELIKELYPPFKERGWSLSVAIPASVNLLKRGYDLEGIAKYVDWLGLMWYDLKGSWDGVTGYHSHLALGDVLELLKPHWGIIVMGIPLYGRSFRLKDAKENGLGAPTVGPGDAGPITGEAGVLAFSEICGNINNHNWTVVDDNVNGTYAYKDDQWVSYVSRHNIQPRIQVMCKYKFAGVMVWDLSQDDFNGIFCKQGNYTLLTEINSQLRKCCQ